MEDILLAYTSRKRQQRLSREKNEGASLLVQWLRLHATSAGGTGSIPGQGTKIPHAACCSQKIRFQKDIKKKKKKGKERYEPMSLRVRMLGNKFIESVDRKQWSGKG